MAKAKKMALGGMGGAANAALQSVKPGMVKPGQAMPAMPSRGNIATQTPQNMPIPPRGQQANMPPPGMPASPPPQNILVRPPRDMPMPPQGTSGAANMPPPGMPKISFPPQGMPAQAMRGGAGPQSPAAPQMQGLAQALRGQQANMGGGTAGVPPASGGPVTKLGQITGRPNMPPAVSGAQAKGMGLGMKKGGMVSSKPKASSASSRGDGIATKGKTKGRFV